MTKLIDTLIGPHLTLCKGDHDFIEASDIIGEFFDSPREGTGHGFQTSQPLVVLRLAGT
jgi:hypothetical protein